MWYKSTNQKIRICTVYESWIIIMVTALGKVRGSGASPPGNVMLFTWAKPCLATWGVFFCWRVILWWTNIPCLGEDSTVFCSYLLSKRIKVSLGLVTDPIGEHLMSFFEYELMQKVTKLMNIYSNMAAEAYHLGLVFLKPRSHYLSSWEWGWWPK